MFFGNPIHEKPIRGLISALLFKTRVKVKYRIPSTGMAAIIRSHLQFQGVLF